MSCRSIYPPQYRRYLRDVTITGAMELFTCATVSVSVGVGVGVFIVVCA